MKIMQALLCVKIETGGNRARVLKNTLGVFRETHGVFSENREGISQRREGVGACVTLRRGCTSETR